MPSDAWNIAARNPQRQPVLLMSVESVDAIRQSITTQADWEASYLISESINTTIYTGSCSTRHIATYVNGTWPSVFTPAWVGPLPNFRCILESVEFESLFNRQSNVGIGTIATFTIYTEFGDEIASTSGLVTEVRDYSPSVVVATIVSLNPTDGIVHSPADSMYIPLVSIYGGDWLAGVNRTVEHSVIAETGSMATKSVDLGLIPTSPSVFGAKDTVSGMATLSYTAHGSDDNAAWTDLGAVIDGGTMAPHRHYRFTVEFASTGPDTPVLEEITVTGGNSQFKYFSTHEDVPVKGAKPLLKNTLGTLTSKLELMKLGSTGEVSPKLFYLKDTFELLRDGELRNKAVSIKQGFLGLAEKDYEPLFSGLWYDGTIDHYAAEISVRTRTILSRFQKAQIPAESAAGSSRTEENVIPKEWINENVMTVMLDIIDYLGIQNRWIDSASASAIQAGARAGNDWIVSRRMDKDDKEEAIKLLEELSVLSGVFILQRPDGRLYFKLYDPDEATVEELTTEIATFSPVELGQAELFTRQQIFYAPRHEGDLEIGDVRGAWASGSDYSRNDSVTVGAVTWYCLQSHQASATDAPGTGAAHRAYWTTDWITETAYVIGDVRISQGPLYTCKAAHASAAANEPGRGLNWRSVWTTQPVTAGDSDEDYHSAYILVNETAEIVWGLNDDVQPTDPDYLKNPGYQRKWYDKWNATPVAIAALAARMDAWFANPKMKLKASNLPPQFYKVQLGAMVGVSGLMLPVAAAEWGVPCSNKKFMVTAKPYDTAKCTVSFDLLEV